MRNQLDGKEHNFFAVYFETNKSLTKEKIEQAINLMENEMQGHTNNMIVGNLNFIDHKL